jgi:serine/threonine protein kinase
MKARARAVKEQQMSLDFTDHKNKPMRVGKYLVLSHLGSGGMGVVYKARDEELGRPVALKILARALSDKPERVDRFRREARHAARLHHENIVTIYEFGAFQDLHFLALEYVDGVDLQKYIAARGFLSAEEACCILTQAACALEHSFEQGIIHRDIKPSNLLIASRHGQPLAKLTDLGIAREIVTDDSRITGAGLIVGTVDYLAPEQARDSAAVDIRSDIYSLGCTLYEMLSGEPPFRGSITELVYKHAEEIPPDISTIRAGVRPGLEFVLKKMLAKKADDRYQTPTQLLADLRRLGELDQQFESRPAAHATKSPAPPNRLQEHLLRHAQTQVHVRRGTDELTSSDRDTTLLANPSPKQHRIAVGQFEKADEAIATGNYEYGIPLLLSCCALDPANLRYRQVLRQAGESNHERSPHLKLKTVVADWLLKARIKAAKKGRAFGKVLELSEQVLVHEPKDFLAQFDAALAAKELGLSNSAVWMLERLRKQQPKSTPVLRALAQLYEDRAAFESAIRLWEAIEKADPLDGEARVKLQELSASQAISRGGYEEVLGNADG